MARKTIQKDPVPEKKNPAKASGKKGASDETLPQVRSPKKPLMTSVIAIGSLIADPDNPRADLKPKDSKYQRISTSMKTFGLVDPIVYDTETKIVIGGHQRLKILLERGETALYALTLGGISWAFSDAELPHLTPETRQALGIALNRITGDWDMPKLAGILEGLQDVGIDLETIGYNDGEFGNVLGAMNPLPLDHEKEWKGMPEFTQADKMGIKSVIIHFETWEDVESFSALVGQTILKRTRFIWFPKAKIEPIKNKAFVGTPTEDVHIVEPPKETPKKKPATSKVRGKKK